MFLFLIFFLFFFSLVVIVIAIRIFFFGQYYIDGDRFQKGFRILLFLFVLSMLFLIFSPNLFSLLLGWDGLGLVSYLLVVYYIRFSRSVAGIVTFLTNRLGDMFFLLSIVAILYTSSLDFFISYKINRVISYILIVTFITKRAQIPFSSWLPAAIAAPTPVSSLVHSSTLVTAGVFLLIRFNVTVIRGYFFLMCVSVLTIIMAGLMANFEWDIKKLIAFSTLSQLGFIVLSLRGGLVLFCFFHLLCHALFKASLFITSGVIIHNLDRGQDFRNSTIFVKITPIVGARVVVCVLCLCGFPFLSGFFSKDFILDRFSFSFFFFLFFLIAVVLTVSYSLRFSFYIMGCIFTIRRKIFQIYDSLIFIILPVWFLVMLSILIGVFWVDFMGLYLFFFSSFWKILYISVLLSAGIFTYFLFYSFFSILSIKQYFFSSIWFLNRIVGFRLGYFFLNFRSKQYKILDQGWAETVGPQGSYYLLLIFSYKVFREFSFIFPVFLFLFAMFFMFTLWNNSLSLKHSFEGASIF